LTLYWPHPPPSLPPLHLRFKTFTSISQFKYQTFRLSVLRRTPKYLSSLEERKKKCPEQQLLNSIFLPWVKRTSRHLPSPSFLIAKEAFEVCFPFLWVFLYYNSFLLLFCLWVKTDFCYFFLGFVDIQSAISKINPELLKSVIASGSAATKTTPENGNQFSNKSFSVPSTPKQEQPSFPALPLYSPLPRYSAILSTVCISWCLTVFTA